MKLHSWESLQVASLFPMCSLPKKTNDKSQKVPNYSSVISVNKLSIHSFATSYIFSLEDGMPLYLFFEEVHQGKDKILETEQRVI